MPGSVCAGGKGMSGAKDLSSLLVDTAQLLDGWKQTSPQDWSDWDQSVRDRLSQQLALLEASKRVTAADLAKTVDAQNDRFSCCTLEDALSLLPAHAREVMRAELDRLRKPTHERDGPHCSRCSCGMEPCEQLEGACPSCNQWIVLKCPRQSTVIGCIHDSSPTTPCEVCYPSQPPGDGHAG